MKIETAELIGPALDWAVAKCEGHIEDYCSWLYEATLQEVDEGSYHPSTDWSITGPIIERESLCVQKHTDDIWRALFSFPIEGFGAEPKRPQYYFAYGPTPLIAAMRCYVASKLGNEVEIPEELA